MKDGKVPDDAARDQWKLNKKYKGGVIKKLIKKEIINELINKVTTKLCKKIMVADNKIDRGGDSHYLNAKIDGLNEARNLINNMR